MPGSSDYLWESPGGTVAVYLAFEARDILNAAIAEAAHAAPVKNAEIGGLLLGRAERDARLVVHIDGVELLPSRYPHGPSFHLDSQDTPDLKRPGIVGYFRSHTRKGLFLSEYDLTLIAEHFGGPDNVFLLIKPFKTRENLGGFFHGAAGKLAGAAAAGEFPFGGFEEISDEPARMEVAGSQLPSAQRNAPRRWPLLMWTGMALLALAGTGSFTYLLLNRMVPPQSPPPAPVASVALTASEGEREITLTWNRQSPLVQTATKGVVEIQEGTFQKTLTLDSEQLGHGSVVYSRPVAIADTVAFKIKLFSLRDKPVSESVQIVSNHRITPNAGDETAPPPSRRTPQ